MLRLSTAFYMLMSWGESDHLLFIRAFASETKLNDIQPFDIITIPPPSVFISLAHWLPRCWFNFCVLFENYRSKLNKTIPLVFPFCDASPPPLWSVSGMKKQKPTSGAFVFQLIPCKCSALSCCCFPTRRHCRRCSGVRGIAFDFQQIFLCCAFNASFLLKSRVTLPP